VSNAKRPYVANKFCLELQNQAAGWLHSAEGGTAVAEVVQERLAGGHAVRKHAGNIKFEELTVACGTSMSRVFYDWLKTSLEYKHERKEGSIIAANYDYKEIARQEFHQALLSEIGLPGVDAASKDSCKFTVKIAPEYTETKYSSGTQSILPAQSHATQQKRWQAANFKLVIDGMHCSAVSKVEPLTIKQNLIENTVGERLICQREPAQIDFPNVVFTIPESAAEPWYKWYEEFVCKGHSQPENEKQGHLEYLAPDCKTVLFLVQFHNLGIIKFMPDKLESTSEKPRNVKIEMYCERIDFEYKPAGTAI